MRILLAIFLIVVASSSVAQDERSVLITNVNVFDGKNPELIKNANVLIQGSTISEVSTDPIAPGDAEVIDGAGGTLMPGLIDNHWHTTYVELPLNIFLTGDLPEVMIRAVVAADRTLMRGFTTVRDVGGNSFSLKKAIDAGDIPGPRIYPSGPPISQTSGHCDFRDRNAVPTNPGDNLDYWQRNAVLLTADGVPEVMKRVRENLRMGAVQIKLAAGGGTSSQFDPLDSQQYTLEELKAAVDVAKTWNTYLTVHVYTSTAVNTALDAGVRVIEHGQMLDDNTMKRIAEEGVWLSLQPFVIDDDSQYSPNRVTVSRRYRS